MLGVAPVALGGLGWFLLRHRRRPGRAGRRREPGPGPAARRPGAAAADDRVGDRRRRCRPLTFITKAPFTGVVPDGARRRHRDPPRPGRRRHRPVPVAARSRSGAGIGLGIAEWTIRWNVDRRVDLRRHVPRRDPRRPAAAQGARSRRAETGESSWDSAGVLKPIPRELRDVAEVRGPRRGARRASARCSRVFVPLAVDAVARSSRSRFAVVWAWSAMSLVVLTGWGGNISLGQFGIVGVGADGRRQPPDALERRPVRRPWRAAMVAGALVAVAIGLPGAAHPGPLPGGDHHRLRGRPRLVLPQPGELPGLRPDHDRTRRCSGSGST